MGYETNGPQGTDTQTERHTFGRLACCIEILVLLSLFSFLCPVRLHFFFLPISTRHSRCMGTSSTCRRTSSCSTPPRLGVNPTSICARWPNVSAWAPENTSSFPPPTSRTRRESSFCESSLKRRTPQSEWVGETRVTLGYVELSPPCQTYSMFVSRGFYHHKDVDVF